MNVNINIVTTQFNELGEENVIKSNVDGTLYQKKDHKYIIYKEIENKENIVNKNINTYEQEDGVDIYVTYEVLENIGTNEKIVF